MRIIGFQRFKILSSPRPNLQTLCSCPNIFFLAFCGLFWCQRRCLLSPSSHKLKIIKSPLRASRYPDTFVHKINNFILYKLHIWSLLFLKSEFFVRSPWKRAVESRGESLIVAWLPRLQASPLATLWVWHSTHCSRQHDGLFFFPSGVVLQLVLETRNGTYVGGLASLWQDNSCECACCKIVIVSYMMKIPFSLFEF